MEGDTVTHHHEEAIITDYNQGGTIRQSDQEVKAVACSLSLGGVGVALRDGHALDRGEAGLDHHHDEAIIRDHHE
jgi:hypothetical protein